ncbi:ras-related protein Rab-10-like isoform X2 [Rana temporaria]|uniref:ras-related protein Rab-10-like isoform X2 n=1 Tax=Rana temporaria TaxID=8407 RepID=UPI001AAD5F7F|nr:ras-related protein Rab-10-like isoform X2 [Rana temporaria]
MAGTSSDKLVLKLVMTGDSNVGKTCIMTRYTENIIPSYISTVGIDFKTKTIHIDDTPLKLQIWDTAGQERFHTLSVSYFRGAQGFVLVYDITNTNSFENISLWIRDIKMLAWEYGIPFFETSAKECINIDKAFLCLSNAIYEKRSSMLINPNLVNLEEPRKSTSCVSCG